MSIKLVVLEQGESEAELDFQSRSEAVLSVYDNGEREVISVCCHWMGTGSSRLQRMVIAVRMVTVQPSSSSSMKASDR